MYDKVKLWIDRGMAGENYFAIPQYLTQANSVTNLKNGEERVYGSLDGLKITLYIGGLSVIGSLPKYLFGNNICSLNRHTTAQALEKLSDALHIPVNEAKVTELEFGTNFVMKHTPQSYIFRLGDMARMSRCYAGSSLYYKGTGKSERKTFVFYDKGQEYAETEKDSENALNGANLLRYEMRLKGRLANLLKVPEVQASTLTDISFYRKVLKYWQDSYFSIIKINQAKTNDMGKIKTVTDAFNLLVALLLTQADKTQIDSFMNDLKDANVFSDKKYYTRLKKKIEEVVTNKSVAVPDELIRELDNEIKNCGAYV